MDDSRDRSFVPSKAQRNQLYDRVQKAELPIEEFRLEIVEQEHQPSGLMRLFGSTSKKTTRKTRLTHLPTRSYFEIGDVWLTMTYPSGSSPRSFIRHEWDSTLDAVGVWVSGIKREMERAEREAVIPDLWSVMQSRLEFQSSDNSPFTDAERASILAVTGQIEGLVRSSVTMDDADYAEIKEQLGYLVEASKRVGRKDWMLMFYGQVVSICFSAAMTTSQAKQFLRSLSDLMQPIVGNVLRMLSN